MHVILHVAPPEQSTLLLGPTAMLHADAEPVHFKLHDSPHDPLQSFVFPQSSVQL